MPHFAACAICISNGPRSPFANSYSRFRDEWACEWLRETSARCTLACCNADSSRDPYRPPLPFVRRKSRPDVAVAPLFVNSALMVERFCFWESGGLGFKRSPSLVSLVRVILRTSSNLKARLCCSGRLKFAEKWAEILNILKVGSIRVDKEEEKLVGKVTGRELIRFLRLLRNYSVR